MSAFPAFAGSIHRQCSLIFEHLQGKKFSLDDGFATTVDDGEKDAPAIRPHFGVLKATALRQPTRRLASKTLQTRFSSWIKMKSRGN